MDKSTIGKKSDFIAATQTFVNFSTEYLKKWTNKQLKTYVDQPVVIPVGDYGFLIGRYKIKGKSKDCWTAEQIDGKHIHDFVTKTNAIIYCIKEMQNKSDASELLELDRQLGKLNNDIFFYQNSIKKSKNEVKNIIALNRCIDAKLQRQNVLNILKKTLNSAKYLNFGNK